ncbi:MAG: hypothetical protein MUQ32_17320 [Chloroflexi bacterium]|nr:hypothetical protein [Chloroflexota bacterium]
MTIDRRLIAGALGLSLVLAACGGTSTATTAPAGTDAATDAPTAEPAATPAATEAPAATEEATDDGGSTGALNDLASKLPAEAGGVTFERAGYNGDQLGIFGTAAGFNSDELDPILKANGKTFNDVNFAIASPTSTSATAMIFALQVEGVPADEFANSMNADTSSMPEITLGGKTVYGEAAGGFGIFAYPKDDVLYMVLLADEEVAASIFEQLP